MNENKQVEQKISLTEQSKPAVIIDAEGSYLAANEKALDIKDFSEDELLDLHCNDTILSNVVEAGAALQKVIHGETVSKELHLIRGDGSSYTAEVTGNPVEINGTVYAEVVTEEVKQVHDSKPQEKVDESSFDHIEQEKLESIVQNIRVDTPSGEMSLNEIMIDLVAGHNEIEQFKEGSVSIHKAVDKRLQEEERRNPDSPECDVLREVKRSAFGLYLRLQRGDKELLGNRCGKYSGYFE